MVSVRTMLVSALAGGLMLVSTGCGGPSREQRALAEKDAQLASFKQREAEYQQQNEEKDKLLSQSSQLNRDLGEQNKQLAERNAKAAMEANAKMDTLQAQIADLKNKLGSNNAGSDVTVSTHGKEPGAIVITVAGTTLFDSGKADLKESSHSTLSMVAQTIKAKYPNNAVRVEGHTDSTPIVRSKDKFEDNFELSYARAKSVFDHLTEKCGMPASRMYIAGYAANQPVIWPEKTAADRAKNRRVDIVILPLVKVEKNSLAAK